RDLIPTIIKRYRVYAYPFRDPQTGEQAYWRDVGTLDAFWTANMELTYVQPPLDLYDSRWPVFTDQVQAPPAKFVFDEPGRRGEAIQSLVSPGCIISGASVRRSVVFSNSIIRSHSVIEQSVILPNSEIMRDCVLDKVIVDRGTTVPAGTRIGVDHAEDRKRGF